jgi:hypothetical protein
MNELENKKINQRRNNIAKIDYLRKLTISQNTGKIN